jgi:hypothetical protein
MTGMGTVLETVVLVVPLMAWLCGTLLSSTPKFSRLARNPSAPSENWPNSRKFHSPGALTWPGRTR